jgi:putative membrane-bound dehydrogenase-like protein
MFSVARQRIGRRATREVLSVVAAALLSSNVLTTPALADDAPSTVAAAPEPSADFDLPSGFGISLYAGDELAHDIFALTLDSAGRVVVSGPGYIKTLIDDNGDGHADRAELFSSRPASGAQGLCFDGGDLLFTGDGVLGRLRDQDGDGRADGPPEVWAKLRGGEHGAHAILLGPDGWFYVVCGNDAGVSASHITDKNSPVREPRSGAVLRVSRDGKQIQVLAHGFRNPYDLAIAPGGQLFAVDSDGERDHHLPWYAPTRLFDVAIGREHGWLSGGHVASWSRPASWADNVPRVAQLGRGSPTGIVCCRHRAFPERYRGGLFSAEWTFGRVYFLPLTPAGSTFTSQPEVFLQSRGSSGFAPVDLEIGPRGDLFIAMGGRRTQGSVYRVSYSREHTIEPSSSADRGSASDAALLRVLRADQPLSAWSRARWVPAARELGQPAIEAAITDESLPVPDRVRAIEVVTELWGSLSRNAACSALSSEPPIAARLAWSLVHSRETVASKLLCSGTLGDDPGEARAAWEAIAYRPHLLSDSPLEAHWREACASTDRFVRASAIIAAKTVRRVDSAHADEILETAGDNSPRDASFIGSITAQRAAMRRRLAGMWLRLDSDGADWHLSSEELTFLADVAAGQVEHNEAVWRLEALRLLMLALGDVAIDAPPERGMVGYVARKLENLSVADREMLAERLAPLIPSGDAELDRELARVLAMLDADVPGLPERVTAKLTNSSAPQDDLHYLFALSRLGGARSATVTSSTAAALVGLHGKLAARGQFVSRTWPVRVTEAFQELCRRDPGLARAVAEAPGFGLPEHAMFVLAMPEADRSAAARRLLSTVTVKPLGEDSEADDGSVSWTTELVQALACLPDVELFPVLRSRADDPNLRDAIVLILARNPQAADAERFVVALNSFDLNVMQKAAAALTELPGVDTAAIAAALRAIDRTIRDEEQAALASARKSKPRDSDPAIAGHATRVQLVALVEHAANHEFEIDQREASVADLPAKYRPLFDWFRAEHPSAAAMLDATATLDLSEWRQRLASIDWSVGNAEAGRSVFERQSCHRCHRGDERRGNDRLGPDLAGAAARFSREDLFVAIVDPSRDVAPLYRTTIVTTRDGRLFQGLIVYESPDGTLLQTGPDATVRVTGDELASQRAGEQSLMPTGLLNGLTDRQLADLDAYLRSLTGEAGAGAH